MTTIETPVDVHTPLCELVGVMQFATDQVYGHHRSADHPHGLFCACPPPWDCHATRLGQTKADALVILLTKFAYQVHTDAEQERMLDLIAEGKS